MGSFCPDGRKAPLSGNKKERAVYLQAVATHPPPGHKIIDHRRGRGLERAPVGNLRFGSGKQSANLSKPRHRSGQILTRAGIDCALLQRCSRSVEVTHVTRHGVDTTNRFGR
ncbi:ABC transporter ATP-binding protein [Anopheles sinensis]|uniref:ABC transporter ATP-binding protein n=1 Tax=Anopheles sinensis TaxID=74873 RepID=A0A084W2G6_ANOSI|nr:ABC transporter ATP-binding protein [Anopheles sinensis]